MEHKRGVQNLVEPTWLSKVFGVMRPVLLLGSQHSPLSFAPMTQAFFDCAKGVLRGPAAKLLTKDKARRIAVNLI
jgi:hypothetical protein